MFKTNLLIVAFFFFSSLSSSCRQGENFRSVQVEEFATLILDEEVQRLDVRTPMEYTEGHIERAININVMDGSFAAMADSLLQKERPVALYCRSGGRSKKAARILSQKGYNVIELAKGIQAWTAAGKEIE